MAVLFGSNSSLAAGQGFSMSSLAAAAASYDDLGDSLVACDLDGDGHDDLVVGVPQQSTHETVGSSAVLIRDVE